MPDNDHPTSYVNEESEFAWGTNQISRIIGRSPRQTYHLLSTGKLKSVKKVGGHWVVSRDALRKELGAV
jgi:Helix-turn-helix domain